MGKNIATGITLLTAAALTWALAAAHGTPPADKQLRHDTPATAATVEFNVRHKRGPRERYGFAEKRQRKRYV